MIQRTLQRSGSWLFFILLYGLSWTFWIPAALLGRTAPAMARTLHYVGGAMPALVAVGLIYLQGNRQVRRDYWVRLIQFDRIEPRWYAILLLLPAALSLVAALLDALFGGTGLQIEAFIRPLAFLPYALFLLLFGPLPEEMGWRGYALDRLQIRHTALASSLIVGAAWTIWHLPLFFIEGTYQQGLVGSLSFGLFFLDKVPQSVVITWIYNHNRRSTLSAVLFHWAVNLTGELFALSERAELAYVLLWIALAVGITAIWGPDTLARGQARHAPPEGGLGGTA